MQLTKYHYQQIPHLLGLKYKKHPSDDGGYFICPLHSPEERTPSLSISFSKGIFHCFSCGAGGTLNKLCKETDGRNIYQVLGLESSFRDLEEPSYPKQEEAKEIKEEDIDIDIRGVVVPALSSKEARSYLATRGISEEIAKKYDFKYAEDIYINERKFIKRLMIPIYGETGKLVNIEGRDVTRKSPVKVLYPKNSIKPLWNIQNLSKEKPLIITEGLMDLFLLEQDPEHFSNLTVIFGSSISPYQKKMLEKFDKIITMFDNDSAGEMAHEKLKKELGKEIDRWKFDSEYKDIGEIWEMGRMTVSDFYKKGGFYFQRDNSFYL